MKEIIKIFASGGGDREWVNNIPNTGDEQFRLDVLLNWLYGAIAVVAVAYIVYSAIIYLTSQGEPGKIKQASQSIAFAVVGLLIVLLAAAITNFVFNAVSGA